MASVIECPSCGSNFCQSYPVLYQQGTSVVSGKTKSTGLVFGSGGVGIGGSSGNFSGVQQTTAGAMASPPAKKGFGGPIALALFGWTIPITIYMIIKRIKYNNEIWPKLYNEWLNTFYCNQCGSSFTYQTNPNAIDVTPANNEIENSGEPAMIES